jgi:hypothetical protein
VVCWGSSSPRFNFEQVRFIIKQNFESRRFEQ